MARTPPPADSGIIDSTAALDSLYQAPFSGFVAARTALVRQLQRSGHKDVAARIASAAKPSRAAWLVNQVYWHHRATYEEVLAAGTAARVAQQARLLGESGADVGQRLVARDAAVARAIEAAGTIARAEGAALSETARGQVRASFEALAAHGQEARLPHGQLTAEVPLPGLAAFAGLVLPHDEPSPARRFEVVPRRGPSEARAATPPHIPPPDPRVVAAEALVRDVGQREQETARRLDELTRGVDAAREVLAAAESAASDAARALEHARHAMGQARATRQAVSDELDRLGRERAEAEQQLRALQAPASGAPPHP